MSKNLFVLLSIALLGSGCIAPVESGDEYEEIDEAEAEITSFFGTGNDDPVLCPGGTPYVKNPSMSSGNLFMQAAGSCVSMPGGTVKVQIPYSVTTYGPYPITWDQSGTLLRVANMGSVIPQGSCRMLTITNSSGIQSSPGTICR